MQEPAGYKPAGSLCLSILYGLLKSFRVPGYLCQIIYNVNDLLYTLLVELQDLFLQLMLVYGRIPSRRTFVELRKVNGAQHQIVAHLYNCPVGHAVNTAIERCGERAVGDTQFHAKSPDTLVLF